jgi:hypothetical protein
VAALGAGALAATAAQAAPPLNWSAAASVDPGTEITALSCPSVGLCVAVDHNGSVVYSTTPASGGWSTPLAIEPMHQLNGVSCPTTSLCFAVDDHGSLLSTTDPASATVWTFGGSIDGTTALDAISCPSASLCVAVDAAGRVGSSTNPGDPSSWTFATIDSGHRLNALSCPSTSLCAAVDNAGQVLVSATPTTTPWSNALRLSPGSSSLTGVSCTPAGLCVAVATDGTVYASANAGSATPTWSSTAVDSTSLNAVSCSAVGVCVLGDQNGSLIASDGPAAAPPAWAPAAADAGRPLTAVSCLADGLCVAVDNSGNALAGTLSAPAVATGSASASSQTTATVNATVNPNDATLSDCHFDYGPTTAYGSSVPCTVMPSATGGSQAVVAQLSGLNAATTYHFRISAASGVASATGADATFTTPAPIKANPSLSGTPAVGNTLTCKPNVTTTTTETVAYQWLSDTSPITGATQATYVIAPTDQGHHLSCQVTISGDGGSAVATSGFDAVPSQSVGHLTESFVGPDTHGATWASAPVSCSPQAAGSCKITLTLTTTQTVKHTTKTVTVGYLATALGAGTKRTLTVSLNGTGRRMLRNHHKLAVTFTVRGTVLGTLTAVLQTDKFTLTGKATKSRKARHAPHRAR